jgi:hypothetical protein
MALRAVGAYRGHHRTNQLVIELVGTAVAVQPRGHRGVHVAAGGLAVHPGLSGHYPQTTAGQPRP